MQKTMSQKILLLLQLVAIIHSSSSQRPPPECGPHQMFTDCGTACPLKCGEAPPELCIAMCVPGCVCEEGYCLDENGDCQKPQLISTPSNQECGPNQFYTGCGTACPLKCGEERPEFCSAVCVEGCFCEEGFCLDKNGDCTIPTALDIVPDEPSSNSTNLTDTDPKNECGSNKSFTTCGTACPLKCGEEPPEFCSAMCVEGCFCDEGYCLDENDTCVKPAPDLNSVKTDSNSTGLENECGPHEFFSECGTACPLKCGEEPPELCVLMCVPGCVCEEGYCLDENDNCVKPTPIPDEPEPEFNTPSFSPITAISLNNEDQCGPHEFFSECGTACPLRCGQGPAEACIAMCVEGCFCEEGYCLDGNDECQKLPPTNVTSDKGPMIPMQSNETMFIAPSIAPSLFQSPTRVNSCGSNQFFTDCGTACPLLCGEEPPEFCSAVCVEGCFCDEGYCLDQNGECMIPIRNAPTPASTLSGKSNTKQTSQTETETKVVRKKTKGNRKR